MMEERELQSALKRLNKVAALEDNWDSYGASKPSERAVSFARDLLRNSKQPKPKISATPEGGIALTWKHGTLEIKPSGQVIPGTQDATELDLHGKPYADPTPLTFEKHARIAVAWLETLLRDHAHKLYDQSELAWHDDDLDKSDAVRSVIGDIDEAIKREEGLTPPTSDVL